MHQTPYKLPSAMQPLMPRRLLRHAFPSPCAAPALSAWRVSCFPRTLRPITTAWTVGENELWRLVEEARTPPVRTVRTPQRYKPGSRKLGDGSSCWRCLECGVEKVATDFYVRAGGYVNSYCKACDTVRTRAYQQTLRGNATVLAANARHRSKLKGWVCHVDTEFILALVLRQQGRCAYSDVVMEMLLPHSDWRMSLERLDNGIGYEADNCALVAAEFNTGSRFSKRVAVDENSGSSKWSLQKVRDLPAQRLLTVNEHRLLESIEAARARPRALFQPDAFAGLEHRLQDFPGHWRCSTCDLWKPDHCFYLKGGIDGGMLTQCKQCCGARRLSYRLTLRGHIQELLGNARHRHKHGKWHGDFELDVDAVLDMLWSQQGRCFYSDVPLRFAQLNVDWMMSLERLDNSKTYTRDNAVLVALEFNTSDRSGYAVSPVFGSSQWSRSKVEHVWGSVTSSAPHHSCEIPRYSLGPKWPSSRSGEIM